MECSNELNTLLDVSLNEDDNTEADRSELNEKPTLAEDKASDAYISKPNEKPTLDEDGTTKASISKPKEKPTLDEDDTTEANVAEPKKELTGSTPSKCRKKVTERQFACMVCGKGFLHSGHLKRHVKIHAERDLPLMSEETEHVMVQPDLPISNEPNAPWLPLAQIKQSIKRCFSCPTCGKGFGRNSHLKRHVKLHENKYTSRYTSSNEASKRATSINNGGEFLDALQNTADSFTSVLEEPKSPVFVDSSESNKVKSKLPKFVDDSEVIEREDPSVKGLMDTTPMESGSPDDNSSNEVNEGTDPRQECLSPVSFGDSSSSSCDDDNSNQFPYDFTSSSNISRIQRSMVDEELSCFMCEKTFGRKSHLTRHLKLHTDIGFHDCDICGKRFLQSAYLKAHISNVHSAVKKELERIYGCSVCDKQFGRMSHLKRHMKLHVGGETYDCEVCGKSFLQNSNLKSHEKCHRELNASIEEGLVRRHISEETNSEYFDCEQCGKCFNQMSGLKAHIGTVHGEPKTFEKCFKCSFCDKQFGRNSHLKRHVKLHTGGKIHTCDLCGRGFMQNGNLKAHIRMVHLKERSFLCTICGKMFLQQSNLNTHMRTHTGEKPYECRICGKDFAQGNQLKYHLRTHSGETPFSCKICGKTFTNNRSCNRHMNTHSGNKTFECSICDKLFYQSNELKVHLRTHTGEKPFSCLICGKEFTNNRGLKRHTAIHSINSMKRDSKEIDGMEETDSEEDMVDESSVNLVMLENVKEEVEAVVKEEPEVYESENEYDLVIDSDVVRGNACESNVDPIGLESVSSEQGNVIQTVNETIRGLTKQADALGKDDNLEGVHNDSGILEQCDSDAESNQMSGESFPRLVSVQGAANGVDIEVLDPLAHA